MAPPLRFILPNFAWKNNPLEVIFLISGRFSVKLYVKISFEKYERGVFYAFTISKNDVTGNLGPDNRPAAFCKSGDTVLLNAGLL